MKTNLLQSKLKADIEAIRLFAENSKQLLLAPPGEKIRYRSGFRTGWSGLFDAQGNLLHNETIYPHPPVNEYAKASRTIQKLVEAYEIRLLPWERYGRCETERFVQNIRYDRKVQIFVVSENGASIYSTSKIAREEFPDYDVTVQVVRFPSVAA